MDMELCRMLQSDATGTDDDATAAWLGVALRQDRPVQACRADAWWTRAAADQIEELAAHLEISQPRAPELCTLPQAVVADFRDLRNRARHLLPCV